MRVTGFLRDTRGSITYVGILFMGLTLAVGGIAVDVMRHEGTRAKVQQTLDACTTSVAVVESTRSTLEKLNTALTECMERGGVPETMATVEAEVVGGSLSTTAEGTQTNFFMKMANASSTTTYNGNSSANLRVYVPPPPNPVEVVLAYEASNAITAAALGTALRAGATAFVDTITEADASVPDGTRPLTSISLVPYTDGVNLPPALMARYFVTNTSNVPNSNCIDLTPSDFTATGFSTGTISATPIYKTMMMADLATTTSTVSATLYTASNSINATVGTTSVPCPPYANNVLRTHTNLASTVKANIATSQFFGGLRWDHGMHWASAMLDPMANSAISPFLPAQPANFGARPVAYRTEGVQKVIVFVNRSGSGSNVTDGSHRIMAPDFTTGMSPIWRNSSVTPALYCIHLPARSVEPKFFQPAVSGVNAWQTECPANFVQLTWPQVWNSVRVQWVAWQLYARGLQTTANPTRTAVQTTFNTIFASMWTSIPFETQRTQFEAECAAAKAQGVVIYTVALDAVERAEAPLLACATSPAHYVKTTAAEFPTVMTNIAQTIKQQANPQ